MSIRYITTGDEFEARGLLGEGRHQLSILKNAMSFQNLQQDQRIARFSDGTTIKCLSCFGQDIVDIYVPPIGKEEEILRPIPLSKYYPAFEAYDGILHDSKFMGVVLCKGGGFEPPYEFIPKESLPEDYPTEPMGELPEERIWWSEADRRLQDIVPKGIADAKLVQKVPTAINISAPGGFSSIITGVDRERNSHPDCDYWKYCGKSQAVFAYTRTESLYKDFAFSYLLPGEVNPGKWPDYMYENNPHSGGNKPSAHLLNLSDNLYYSIQGSGGSIFFGAQFVQAVQFALKFVVDFILFGIPYGHFEEDPAINFDTVRAEAESYVDYAEISDLAANYFIADQKFSERVGIVMGTGGCSYLDTEHSPFYFSSSILDDDHYALVYSLNSSEFGKTYTLSHPVSDICIDLWCNGYGLPDVCTIPEPDITVINNCVEGPLNVAIDGKVFELFPQSSCPTAPRLQWAYLKYFRIGNRSIGMFHIMKNYDYPLDYIYVYAEIQHKEGEPANPEITQLVITEAGHNTYVPAYEPDHVIPDVTDLDGNTLYGRGKFRLIYEEEEKSIIVRGG